MDISNQLTPVFNSLIKQVQEKVTEELVSQVRDHLATLNFRELVADQVSVVLADKISQLNFPEESIPASALKFAEFKVSGDNIDGGIIQNFGSTGIDDQASKCQLTILDSQVVVESPILTTGLDVRGDVTIAGNLTLAGGLNRDGEAYITLLKDVSAAVHEGLDKDLFLEFTDVITKTILNNGIEFTKVMINNNPVLTENSIGPTVIESNLRKVGELSELQVSGESFLSQTLYTSKKRVGINTIEPSAALSVWDEDVELSMGKLSQGRGFIGTNRQLAITLSANGKNNISLDPDGSVTINDLRLGALPISTASIEPNWKGRTGEILFNDNPVIGGPIGWVCLDGHRWGKFGIIQEC